MTLGETRSRRARAERGRFVVWSSGQCAVRLFCVPHLGGWPTAFRDLAGGLDPEIDPWIVRLPGREGLIKEAPIDDWSDLLDYVAGGIADLTDMPYALLGDCAGAVVAFAVCCQLENVANPPLGLIVCGHPGPHLEAASRAQELAALPSAEFWTAIAGAGLTPPEILQSGMRRLLEPSIRADCRAYGGYTYPSDAHRSELGVPITSIQRADTTRREACSPWRHHTSSWYLEIGLPGESGLLRNPLLAGAVSSAVRFVRSNAPGSGQGG
jgi:surfactin synthase thioesterase subunit